MKKTKIALIGLGRKGLARLKACFALKDTITVTGICDTDTALGHKVAQEYDIPFFPDFHKLVGKADAVIISSPAETHFEAGHFFLDNGVHALIEEPLALNIAQAEELIRASRFKTAKLQISHPERFYKIFRTIKDIKHPPLLIQCERLLPLTPHPKKNNVLLDLMIEDIHIAQSLIQSPVKTIHAAGVSLLSEKDDLVNAHLTFANGTTLNMVAGRISSETTHKIRVMTKETSILVDLIGHTASMTHKDGSILREEHLPMEKKEPLQKELEHFITCIQEDKTPLISGEDARDALKTALMIQETLWTRPPVRS